MTGWVGDIEALTVDNTTFRTVLHTAARLQLTVMCLQPGEEIGLEMHDHLDQFIRIESGQAKITLGPSADEIETTYDVADDWAVIIPGGTWHNVINSGSSRCGSTPSTPRRSTNPVRCIRPRLTPRPPRPSTTGTELRPSTGSGHVTLRLARRCAGCGPIMLDGGLATQLEAQGHDLSSALWSARLLTDDPDAIVAAHRPSSRRVRRWPSPRPTRRRWS